MTDYTFDYMSSFQAASTHPPSSGRRQLGFSPAKVGGVGAGMAALLALLAFTMWRGPRGMSMPLFCSLLASALVLLVVTGAGAVAAERVATGSLWVVNKAVCTADDVVCAARARDATAWVGLLCSCVLALYVLRWFVGCRAGRELLRAARRR